MRHVTAPELYCEHGTHFECHGILWRCNGHTITRSMQVPCSIMITCRNVLASQHTIDVAFVDLPKSNVRSVNTPCREATHELSMLFHLSVLHERKRSSAMVVP